MKTGVKVTPIKVTAKPIRVTRTTTTITKAMTNMMIMMITKTMDVIKAVAFSIKSCITFA